MNVWPDARFKRTFGLGHGKVLPDVGVINATVDFLQDRVTFSHPPEIDQWSLVLAAQGEHRRALFTDINFSMFRWVLPGLALKALRERAETLLIPIDVITRID